MHNHAHGHSSREHTVPEHWMSIALYVHAWNARASIVALTRVALLSRRAVPGLAAAVQFCTVLPASTRSCDPGSPPAVNDNGSPAHSVRPAHNARSTTSASELGSAVWDASRDRRSQGEACHANGMLYARRLELIGMPRYRCEVRSLVLGQALAGLEGRTVHGAGRQACERGVCASALCLRVRAPLPAMIHWL